MKKVGKYTLKMLHSIYLVVIYIVVQLGTLVIASAGYFAILKNKAQHDLTYINDNLIMNETKKFIIQLGPYITLGITLILLIIFFIIYFKKDHVKKHVTIDNDTYTLFILTGISTAVLLNLIIVALDNIIPIYTINNTNNISIVLLIILTGFIGPIIEEVLFRGIVYNRIRKFNSLIDTTILVAVIFALTHNNPINMIYAFCLGIILNLIYHKYHNLKAPIIAHISANLIILLFRYSIYSIYI